MKSFTPDDFDERMNEGLVIDMRGEGLAIEERVLVSPCRGRIHFCPPGTCTTEGEIVFEDQVVAWVHSVNGEEIPVRSPIRGWFMGCLVPDRSPVQCAEGVAWIRPL